MALQDWLSQLQTPINAGQSTGDLQKHYNQLRSQIQGAGKMQTQGMQSALLGKGFRSGESGFADAPLMQLQMQTGKNLADASTNIYLDEAKRRMDMAGLNLQRMLGGGELEASLVRQKIANKPALAALDWERERFGQTFPWEKEQAEMSNLFNLMGMMGQSQQQVYAPWWDAMGRATTS